ncbi:putative protein S-acyltransferase 14 [Camellia lanceoleosa]|uniref:Uncharacterized protein n=1 Tax=Camellia lanceoleosa TaxID=1840588 RepID=A0ACC0J5A3_9ERIC|nr:putative protein S-acyltransferase 14 [Camellia lanceoleosa]
MLLFITSLFWRSDCAAAHHHHSQGSLSPTLGCSLPKFTVVFTDPGTVPPNWRPVSDEERGETDPLTEVEFGVMSANPVNPRIRYCRKCNQLKPPRCHYCSVCGRCVLKMDHHCVWVVNCVGGIELQVFSSFPGMFFLLLNH